MARLHGKVAAVTGAGSGIGRALAATLAARGCRLALADIDEAGLAGTAAALPASAEVMTTHLDVSDRAAVDAWAGQVEERFGAVHLVVNNAGIALAATAEDMTDEDLDRVLDVNLHGVLHGSQAFLPRLIASGDGHLVNISSLFGLIPMPTQSAYNTAKYGVRGYTEAVATEMMIAGHPVSVHCVHPGGIRTAIARSARTAAAADADVFAAWFDAKMARTSPEKAAETIVRGVERGRRRILVGADAYAAHALGVLSGARMQPLLAWLGKRVLRDLGYAAALDGTTPSRAGVRGGSDAGPGAPAQGTEARSPLAQ